MRTCEAKQRHSTKYLGISLRSHLRSLEKCCRSVCFDRVSRRGKYRSMRLFCADHRASVAGLDRIISCGSRAVPGGALVAQWLKQKRRD
ncbi:hypothetical protein AB4084_34040, partial [Lysobacter sp. 2RAB21]